MILGVYDEELIPSLHTTESLSHHYTPFFEVLLKLFSARRNADNPILLLKYLSNPTLIIASNYSH